MSAVAAGPAEAVTPAAGARWRRVGAVVAGWITLLAIWTIATNFIFNPYILPGPTKVASTMWDLIAEGSVLEHFWYSLMKTAIGFVIAVAVGLPIGFAMGRSRYWRAFFHMPVIVAGNVPGITYAVLALVIFGIGIAGPIVAVALTSLPYIAVNVAAGLDGVDRNLLTMARAFGRSRSQVMRHVLIPTVVPFMFAGVRLSFAIAWKVEAITEVFGSSNGLGFMIKHSYDVFSLSAILAWMFFFVVFMLLIERFVLAPLERHLFRWRPAQEGAA